MDKKIGWGIVALVGLAAGAVGFMIAREWTREMPEAEEPQVERWEDEGGNVPDVEAPAAG
jgi:hypothetical protein